MTANMRFGAEVGADGVTFRLWAPAARRVELVLDKTHPMQVLADGWYEIKIAGLQAGALYRYRIDGDLEVPDPASHFQPSDIDGPSEVIEHDCFDWRATSWRGRPWAEAVIVELHVGTFTRAGTFRSAIDHFDGLVEAGITAIELMPIGDFAGRRNWGYDGVLLFAPDSTYGRPDDLRAMIDEAHARGLMVLLDVVYNHFGPQANYLPRYAPQFFAPAQTPWGSAIDYGVPQVRAFAIANALHWISRYRFDGLRLDAVHAISLAGEPSILRDISSAVGNFARLNARAIHLVLENDDNRASLIDPETDPPRGKYRAQWNDDYHHAWHVLLTGENNGYYRDYATDPADHLARVLRSGFAFQGETSPHRGGRPRGESTHSVSPLGFVNFLQNHDQIGNRPCGDRLVTQVGKGPLTAALAITLLAPMPPLLFMGEEWGATEPFAFFCDFLEPLASAVREGRRADLASTYGALASSAIDPLAEETFLAAVLDWDARSTPAGRKRLGLVRELLSIRRREVTPHLADMRFATAQSCKPVLQANWTFNGNRSLNLLANLSAAATDRPKSWRCSRPIWGGEPAIELPPWGAFWSIGPD
jgi:malto-oligosyltrehalose trehalohydrolase